ncbi:hypothetical protein Hanom_Chr06g00530591 [Helianthus anomalus]
MITKFTSHQNVRKCTYLLGTTFGCLKLLPCILSLILCNLNLLLSHLRLECMYLLTLSSFLRRFN